jgi:agmatinase
VPKPPTMPLNFLALQPNQSRLSSAKVVVLPIPYDATASYRTGTREGPRALIEASRYLEEYDSELDLEICKVGIHTADELEPHVAGPRKMVDRIEKTVTAYLKKSKFVATLGGEHTVSLGSVRAHAKQFPDMSVLYLDAHADLRNEYQGSKFSHACIARRITETVPVVEVGVRSLSSEEHSFITEKQIPVFFRTESHSNQDSLVEEIVEQLSESVYVSLDLDVLDPSIMAAVGTPEPGGMSWEEMTKLLRTVAKKRHIIGFDINELSPQEGPTACSFTAAKLAYKLIGYSLRLGTK